MTNYIYALLDPETNEIRYIGKTDNPSERLKNHLNETKKWHKCNWIKSLKNRGLKPVMSIIEEIPDGQKWEEREIYWIAYYRSIGISLTNQTDGGECGPDCTGMHLKRTPQGLENIRKALIARNKSPEMRAISVRNGLANKGRKHTKEAIEKIRRFSTGRKCHDDKFKKALADRNRARQYSDEDKQKMRSNARRLWDDPIKGPELRAKLAERNKKMIHKPREFSIEDKQKLSENSRKLWDDPIKGEIARAKLSARSKASRGKPRKRKHQSDLPR